MPLLARKTASSPVPQLSSRTLSSFFYVRGEYLPDRIALGWPMSVSVNL